MKIAKVKEYNFCANTQNSSAPRREFIDVITDAVKNPRDVNDCVAVPRGIFKAYILIMTGAALMGIAALLPKRWSVASKSVGILGNIFYILSAIFFAKCFAFKGLSPTVDKDTVKPVDQ